LLSDFSIFSKQNSDRRSSFSIFSKQNGDRRSQTAICLLISVFSAGKMAIAVLKPQFAGSFQSRANSLEDCLPPTR
jgi:hypothetical protein